MLLLRTYLYKTTLCCFLFLLCCGSKAQEICNNGIDDDSDGLIDLNDPLCQCHFKVSGNLLQNGSFESYDHCPLYTYDKDYNNVSYWQYGTYTHINEADFYHNLTCVYDSQQVMRYMPPLLPLPDGQAFVAILNTTFTEASISEDEFPKSYIGQCLQTPLKAGEDYTLSFYAGRFRSWDNPTGKLFPFTVAIFGNRNCNAVPFGKINGFGNGCPANYDGWILLGKTTVYTKAQWVQSKIKLTVPYDINVIEIGADCTKLPPVIDLADSTTYMDYHLYYLDDVHLLPTKDFPFKYIQTVNETNCTGYPVLKAPEIINASYQWYKDSIAIKGATNNIYRTTDTVGKSYYNVLISTDSSCIISEPFLVTASDLSKINIPADTVLCSNHSLTLAPSFEGIIYTVNGVGKTSVVVEKQGFYNITAKDIYGCERNFSIKVIAQNCTDCSPFIPTAFTPNDDGLNDIFTVKLNCTFSSYQLNIYNRWGEKIFSSNDISKGWDGNYDHTKMLSGSYIYFLNYKTAEGILKTFRGFVVLIR